MCTRLVVNVVAAVSVFVVGVHSAAAQVVANSVIFNFKAGDRPVQNVFVSNSGAAPLYVGVKIQEAVDLSAEKIEFVDSDKLLLSPRNFSLAPNGQRTVRMLLKKPLGEKEGVFRVLLVPQQTEFGQDQTRTIDNGDSKLVMHVATGVGLLVYIEPARVRKELAIIREEKGIRLQNTGNIQAQLIDGTSCPTTVTFSPAELKVAEGETRQAAVKRAGCSVVEGKRLHAQRDGFIEVPPSTKLFFNRRFGIAGEYEPIEIEPFK
jgi:P pilus assembly chaperone PapD